MKACLVSRSAISLVSTVLTLFLFHQVARATDTESVLPNGNTADGAGVLTSLTSGIWNTGFGFNALHDDTSGSYNTAQGYGALTNDANGSFNTADGTQALFFNVSGYRNTAVGSTALYRNTASFNTAVGASALFSNTTAAYNTAVGYSALGSNTTGGTIIGEGGLTESGPNTAVGALALSKCTTSGGNVAVGFDALGSLISSENVSNGLGADTAVGYKALANASGGFASFNSAFGFKALFKNTTGNHNSALGSLALGSNTGGFDNVGCGFGTLLDNVNGNGNVAIGTFAGASITASGNVCIGQGVNGAAGENFTTRISNIGSTPQNSGIYVTVNAVNGTKLGYASSSRRFKEDIQPMDNASETIFALKPVSYRMKHDIDPTGTRQYGLIAEEVVGVDADLVARDTEGKPGTVRYDSINAMLLNEFLKEHKKVQTLESELAGVKAQLKEQAAQIQKVAAQIATNTANAQLAASK